MMGYARARDMGFLTVSCGVMISLRHALFFFFLVTKRVWLGLFLSGRVGVLVVGLLSDSVCLYFKATVIYLTRLLDRTFDSEVIAILHKLCNA